MEKNNEKSKSNDSKVIIFSSDGSFNTKENNNSAGTRKTTFKSDDLTSKSILGSELNSELSETEKLSIIESHSSDDENITPKEKPPPVKVSKGSKELVVSKPKVVQPPKKKLTNEDKQAQNPASIRAKCACKYLSPGKVNNPIGETEGSKIWVRPKMIGLEYDPMLHVEILKSKAPFVSKKAAPKAPKKSPFPGVASKLPKKSPKDTPKTFKPS